MSAVAAVWSLFISLCWVGTGVCSAAALSLLAKILELDRTANGILLFLILGAIVGVVTTAVVYTARGLAIVFFFYLPLSALINSVIITFIYALIALALGLVIGCSVLPKPAD